MACSILLTFLNFASIQVPSLSKFLFVHLPAYFIYTIKKTAAKSNFPYDINMNYILSYHILQKFSFRGRPNLFIIFLKHYT